MGLLERVQGPADLRQMGVAELNLLAEEIRQVIIETVSVTGGHLAPSLGVVELTLALHTVFNSPVDKIIWDVGHQTYAHKLVTGRRKEFHTLRQLGGLSGFPKFSESPHDVFQTGHSSTAISAALGMAKARDLQGASFEVVAVVGDGSLTGGISFEALNHAGHDGTHLIIVLNDNEMSIASNVGALSGYLSRLRTDPRYSRFKADLDVLLHKIPGIGETVARAAERLKDSLKYLVVPGMLFEELGFTYLGPVDGHNITAMQEVLRRARQVDGPVMVHVLTRKGKGYAPAEREPHLFHGVGPFEKETGRILKTPGPPTYSQVFGKCMIRLAERDPRVVAITAAMRDGTGLQEFARRFPRRFFDVGIAEQHAVTFAAGLATQGLRPVVAIYSTFLQRAYDQIIHDVALPNLPVIFALDRAGVVGDDGATHQGMFDLSYLRLVPNLSIMAPRDEEELQRMLQAALEHQGPSAIRYPRSQGRGIPLQDTRAPVPWGKAEILRWGGDVALVAIGSMVHPALEAAEGLAGEGIQCTVVDARFVKPLDVETIKQVAGETERIVTVEENVLLGGFGSAVLEMLNRLGFRGIAARTLGLPDEFIEHGPRSHFLQVLGLEAEGIAGAVRELVRLRGSSGWRRQAARVRK